MEIKNDLISLLKEIIDEGKYSNLALNSLFEKKYYSKEEKSFINNILNIVLKNKIYIDYVISVLSRSPKNYIKHLLRISIAQILYTNADEKGVVYEAVELAKEKNEYMSSFVNAFLRNFLKRKDEIFEKASLDIRLSYPKWIFEKIKNQFKEDYLKVLKRYKERSYFSVRVNHRKISKEDFLKILKEINTKLLFNVKDVYYLSNNNILKTKYYLEEDIYIQDASSYLSAFYLDVSENDEVLDVAAAPGGKTLTILDIYNPKKLVATDLHIHKVLKLKEFEKKYFNLKVINADARKFNEGKYDKILLDLPCSGLGVLSKKPEKIYNLTKNDIKEIKKLQKDIFDNCYKLLKENGIMIYSTCTILENENTNNVEYFLNKYKDLEVVNIEFEDNIKIIKDKFGGNLISYENIYMDGFYIIKLRKK